jgi:uncharacterized protein (TIGR02118 family)
MAAKIIVLYPRPKDTEAFDRMYHDEHVPMVGEKMPHKTKVVISKVVSSPQGEPPFHLVVELHYKSMADLQASAGSAGGKETVDHAHAISTGGAPIFLITEEETLTF